MIADILEEHSCESSGSQAHRSLFSGYLPGGVNTCFVDQDKNLLHAECSNPVQQQLHSRQLVVAQGQSQQHPQQQLPGSQLVGRPPPGLDHPASHGVLAGESSCQSASRARQGTRPRLQTMRIPGTHHFLIVPSGPNITDSQNRLVCNTNNASSS